MCVWEEHEEHRIDSMHSFVDHSPISSPNSSPPQFMEEGSCSPRMNLNLDLHLLKNSNSSPDNGCESPTLAALHRFLPSNNEDSWSPEHLYACDEFRMFEFKVRRCMRGRSHDWTECPFAHPGEKARRRDPRRFHYSGTACPDFRKGSCKSGDACDLAHGVFECWLHPARYRTQPCKDGRNCKRKVCFFAHTPEQLRLPPPASPPMSPMSDTSPPLTPRGAARDAALLRQAAVLAEAQAILRHAHLERMNSMPHVDPDRRSRLLGQSLSFNGRPTSGLLLPEPSVGYSGSYGGSPVSSPYGRSPLFRSSDCGRSIWADSNPYEEQRVESGRDLRAKVYGKIMKENLPECGDCPDLGWVNELVAIN